MIKLFSFVSVLTQSGDSSFLHLMIASLVAAVGFLTTKQMRKQKRALLFKSLNLKLKNAFAFKRRGGGGGNIALAILLFVGLIVGAVYLFNLSWLMVLEVVIGFLLLALLYFWLTSKAGK